MKKVIIILFVVSLVALSGIFIYFNQSDNAEQKINEEKVVVDKGGQVEEIDVGDWLTYRNEEFGFEFKYPGDWIIGEGKMGDDYVVPIYLHEEIIPTNPTISKIVPRVTITVFNNPDNKTQEQVVEEYNNLQVGSLNLQSYENIVLDGRVTIKYIIPSFLALPALVFEYHNNIYAIVYSLDDVQYSEFIRNFKFID